MQTPKIPQVGTPSDCGVVPCTNAIFICIFCLPFCIVCCQVDDTPHPRSLLVCVGCGTLLPILFNPSIFQCYPIMFTTWVPAALGLSTSVLFVSVFFVLDLSTGHITDSFIIIVSYWSVPCSCRLLYSLSVNSLCRPIGSICAIVPANSNLVLGIRSAPRTHAFFVFLMVLFSVLLC